MNKEVKEILEYLKDEDDYIEDFGIKYKRIHINNGDLKTLLDYITDLQNLLKLRTDCLKMNQERIDKAIEIYEKRTTCEYKKKRFMEDKGTSDLMYDVLKGEDK